MHAAAVDTTSVSEQRTVRLSAAQFGNIMHTTAPTRTQATCQMRRRTPIVLTDPPEQALGWERGGVGVRTSKKGAVRCATAAGVSRRTCRRTEASHPGARAMPPAACIAQCPQCDEVEVVRRPPRRRARALRSQPRHTASRSPRAWSSQSPNTRRSCQAARPLTRSRGRHP